MRNQSRRFPFSKWNYGGCVEVALFEDTAVSRRYRRVFIYRHNPTTFYQKSPPFATGHSGFLDDYTYHYIVAYISFALDCVLQSGAFLFLQDSFGSSWPEVLSRKELPRCRSPPSPFRFTHPPKPEWRYYYEED